MNFRLSYLLYGVFWLLVLVFFIILSTQKLLIAQYILSKNGYNIFYKKASEYLFSINIEGVKVYKNYEKVADISYMNAGFYPPFILNATLTCGNGYMNIKDNVLNKSAFIHSKNFPFECLKMRKAGLFDANLRINKSGAYGVLDIKNMYIKGYDIKSLKLYFNKNIFHLVAKIVLFNTLYEARGDGLVHIDKYDITSSKISGNLVINTPIKVVRLVVSGTVVNPYLNIQ